MEQLHTTLETILYVFDTNPTGYDFEPDDATEISDIIFDFANYVANLHHWYNLELLMPSWPRLLPVIKEVRATGKYILTAVSNAQLEDLVRTFRLFWNEVQAATAVNVFR